jgi:hypothetical protein
MNYSEKYIKYKNKYNKLKILSGGMKIVINNIVSRNTITIEQFENIFRYATNVETVSENSVTGFIFRITIPENITPFRSDIIDIDNKLMNLEKNMLANTGLKLIDIVFKICIIQNERKPEIENFNSIYKKSCTLKELENEYYIQRKIYDTTMTNGGIPVCPDVISLLIFSNINFKKLFIDPQPCNLSNIFSNNPIFKYIDEQVNKENLPITRSVGIILMESIPSSYKQLKILNNDTLQKNLFIEMSKRVLANYLIIFFRSGQILLDAHLGNWMYDDSQSLSQFKVKAIDFGAVIDRNTELNIIITLIYRFFEKKSIIDINKFIKLMDHKTIINITLIEFFKLIKKEFIDLNCLIKKNQDGRILWQPDSTPININISDTKVMQIDSCIILIHRIFVISAFIDYFYNNYFYGIKNNQMLKIFNILFRNRCSNLDDMIKYKLGVNLINYLNVISAEAKEFTILTYMDIKEYIRSYLVPSPSRE